jgi:hypothetical protein
MVAESGFNAIWCGWIKAMVMGSTLCVKIHNISGTYFGTHRVKQGRVTLCHLRFLIQLQIVWLKCSENLR